MGREDWDEFLLFEEWGRLREASGEGDGKNWHDTPYEL